VCEQERYLGLSVLSSKVSQQMQQDEKSCVCSLREVAIDIGNANQLPLSKQMENLLQI